MISEITLLVKKLGIRGAWLSMLAAEIGARPELNYVVRDKMFKGVKPLENRALQGLTIGEIGILYEYCVALIDPASRKGEGQFFTPDDVAEFLVSQTKKFTQGIWMDPCSGIGNLSWHLVDAQKDKEKFLLENLVLMDKDALALDIARVLFTISFQKNIHDLFHRIKDSFRVFDFLSVSDNGQQLPAFNSDLAGIPSHDFVLVNPPYLAVAKADIRFELASCKDLYGYFLENIMKTSKGFVSITPQSFTHAGKFGNLREFMLAKFPNIRIYNFDNIPGNIFYGFKFGSSNSNTANSIRVAITVARQGKPSNEITSLLRWRTSERLELFMNIDRFVSETTFNRQFFAKVSSIFAPLYKETLEWPRLESLFASTETSFPLFIPSSPRYFISALKTPVKRASMKTLFFQNEKDQNRAYLLLNSSLAYWWWRVRDGGMTLSLETLKSVPLPKFSLNSKLIDKLEKSETTNLVYKQNAGSAQENV